MRSICVYCGSSPGADPLFLANAKALGKVIAETDRVLVYGGAKVGLMGALADSALAAGGKVIGVVPQALAEKKVAHDSLTELHVVLGMHERKKMMADLAAERAVNTKDYLVTEKGIDASRVIVATGTADGQRSFDSTCRCVADHVRIRSSCIGSGDVKPFTMPTVTGKKHK